MDLAQLKQTVIGSAKRCTDPSKLQQCVDILSGAAKNDEDDAAMYSGAGIGKGPERAPKVKEKHLYAERFSEGQLADDEERKVSIYFDAFSEQFKKLGTSQADLIRGFRAERRATGISAEDFTNCSFIPE